MSPTEVSVSRGKMPAQPGCVATRAQLYVLNLFRNSLTRT